MRFARHPWLWLAAGAFPAVIAVVAACEPFSSDPETPAVDGGRGPQDGLDGAVSPEDASTNETDASPDAGAGYLPAVDEDAPSAHWRLGEVAGVGTAKPRVGVGDLTLLGGEFGHSGAIVGDPDSAVLFAAGDALTVTEPSLFAFTEAAPFTLEAWIFPTEATNTTARYLFAKETTSTDERYGIYLNTGTGANGLTLERVVGGEKKYARVDPALVTLNQWHHVVGTYNGGALTLYLDGVLGATYADARSIGALTKPLTIGTKTGGTSTFIGAIDEVAVYPVALDIARVKAHWQQGSGKP